MNVDDNPLDDILWLKGKWVGKGIYDEQDVETELIIKQHSETILKFKEKIVFGESKSLKEEGYFFQDNLNISIKQIIIATEGYIYTCDVEYIKNAKTIKSTFLNGYNLPPNSIIERAIIPKDKKQFTSVVKLGKHLQTYSKIDYSRK